MLSIVFILHKYFFKDEDSLCSPGLPRTHYIDQAGLDLTEICLPLLRLKVFHLTAQLGSPLSLLRLLQRAVGFPMSERQKEPHSEGQFWDLARDTALLGFQSGIWAGQFILQCTS